MLAQPELSLAAEDGPLGPAPTPEGGGGVAPGEHPYLPEGTPALWGPAAAAALQAQVVPNFGYACLNMQLRRQKPACFTNRCAALRERAPSLRSDWGWIGWRRLKVSLLLRAGRAISRPLRRRAWRT